MAQFDVSVVGLGCNNFGTRLDVDETAEVIRALVDNANEHGRAPVSVAVTESNETVLVCVGDDGPGVPPALREVIFERGVTSAPRTHTGLGLYAARRLARAHGGDLRLSDTDDTAFVLTLPKSAPLESAGSLDGYDLPWSGIGEHSG